MPTLNEVSPGSLRPRAVSPAARGARRLLGGAGLVLTGATLAAGIAALLPAPEASAASVNYVRGMNPDAVSMVLLDEEVAVTFNAPVLPSSVGPDTILIRTGLNNGEQAHGRYVVGSFMYDRSAQQRVVIRPEAIQEYYQLVKGLPRVDATIAAKNLIRRIETTGRFGVLRSIDTKLRAAIPSNESNKVGTRLDEAGVNGSYPSQLADATPDDNDDPLTFDAGDDLREPYRTRIAGDDALWQAYLNGGDTLAFRQLADTSEYERFFHGIDPATGIPAASSVLRRREYRRVLINRRNSRRVMFVPDLPIRSDLTDTGYAAGRGYKVEIPASKPGVFATVLTRDDLRPLLQKDGRDFATNFNTVPATTQTLFRAAEGRTGNTGLQKPKIINTTPPNGESFIDPTTDWEDPDNQFSTTLPQRRTFTIRLRFAQPLDPRSISPASITVSKKATIDSAGNETPANPPVPIAVGTFLNQHRLGIVEVEITPATNLDPSSRYEVVAKGIILSLGGESMGPDQPSSFTVGAGVPALDAIREGFETTARKADPNDPDTLGQVTSAYWRAPDLYDVGGTYKLVPAFMPFAGTGVGAPADPRLPAGPTNPISANRDLVLVAGQSITFLTEAVDPTNPIALGTQIEYNYTKVDVNNAAISTQGRFPLVIRSQQSITVTSSVIRASGQPGQDGVTNASSSGNPPGGIGGLPGPGGFRGGDGGCAPLTDSQGNIIFTAGGDPQFDQNKFNGSDGFPSYLSTGPKTGGAGAGGFNGDADQPSPPLVDYNGDGAVPNDFKDSFLDPFRFREAGGGGGHATAGSIGVGSGVTGKTHTGGYFGGAGGRTYGKADFSDQTTNGIFGTTGVPVLGYGSGGAGGGGGGAEDNSPSGTAPDALANGGDGGGGGGGGGGGAIQLVARTSILIDSSVIDVSGGRGGRTFNVAHSDYGKGAPGGCGAGGSIWFQCYGDITIQNGSSVTAAGGDNSTSIGYVSVDQVTGAPLTGKGGRGGDGFIRFEDADGSPVVIASTITPAASSSTFRPFDNPSTAAIETDYQAFPGAPFVVNFSQAFSRWFNTQLDTPGFAPHDDDPATPAVDGTKVFTGPVDFQSQVDIWVRAAPNDTTNNGHPNLGAATSTGNTAPWTPYLDVNSISRRRFLQFRVDFTVPLSYDFNVAKLPYVDFLQIDINLN